MTLPDFAAFLLGGVVLARGAVLVERWGERRARRRHDE